MSIHLIKNYLAEVERTIQFGGSRKETSIRTAFQRLLDDYARQKGLMLIPEIGIKTKHGKTIYPDGTLKDSLRQDWGYWESKDEADDINEEIRKKFAKDYPNNNILFEDSQTAILFQNGAEVLRVRMNDEEALDELLTRFVHFERPEVTNFRKAIELFKQDVPKVTDTLRDMLHEQEKINPKFVQKRNEFLKLCQDSINPDVTKEDVHEMMIQHVLTEDIFNTIFDETQFHRENNIARQLESVLATFFTGATRRTALGTIQHYYQVINAAAAGIADHHEKQKFLKVVYETFYKSYNPKAADRLGVVYTPNEIVQFMIQSTDYLLHKHFGKFLEDPGVDILDPATGTGTFVCDLIDYIRKDKLAYKYATEIHANEVAILPYYISNLNIEYTYKQKMGAYAEFENLCFVDTLDNMGFAFRGKQMDLFSPFTEENTQRIKKQNDRKIAVIIGNPPYNANQANENDNNKNREYLEIDKRIKDTYVKYSNTSNKANIYDMYARFYRWAMDRLDNNGVIAFVTNRSFIDSRAFDGFRKSVQQDFDYAYIVDTKSDVRANPKIAGTTHNVFGIQTGVAILLLVRIAKPVTKSKEKTFCRINYIALDDFMRKEDKLHWLATHPLKDIPFELVQPDKNNNWINMADNDFESLLPLCDKKVKAGDSKKGIFELFSNGAITARDFWVYDLNKKNLKSKMQFFINSYLSEQERWENSSKDILSRNFVNRIIKWSDELFFHLEKGTKLTFREDHIRKSLFRPFYKSYEYVEKVIVHRFGQMHNIFPNSNTENTLIAFSYGTNEFACVASDSFIDFALLKFGNGSTQCLPLYRYDAAGNRQDNITDWGLNQFRKHYKSLKPSSSPPGEEEGDGGSAESSSPVCYADSAEVQEAYKPLNPDPSPQGGEGSDPLGTRGVPGHLIAFARQLRKDSTDAEDMLWQLLRNRQLNGAKFRRQHPVATGYILDFYCAEHRLAIEVDGSIHDLPEQAAYDAERTQHLEQFNVKVIRFSNAEVLTQTEWVLSVITTYLSSSSLPPLGEGSGLRGQRRARTIQKEDIFHYVYAVLHHPAYRTKYDLNLKREFPRVPLYDDFWQWAAWGKALLDLHIHYESVEPFQLAVDSKELAGGAPKVKLKADKEKGKIVLDEETTLSSIPAIAWNYKLGNRSALEWILDQYKESKPKDPTIAEKFNTYRFADYKEQVIDLIQRVTTVSVETMQIIGEMP